MERRKRRSFNAEFKAEAVRLVREGSKSLPQVAKDLDLTESALRNWVNEVDGSEGKASADALTGAEQEELVRLHNHIQHFTGLLDQGGEVGKKLDFLLQELNREANTLLSKTSGVAGDALRITELGLQMKSEIEKCREQVQNLE